MRVLLVNDTRKEDHYGCLKVMTVLEESLTKAGAIVVARAAVGECLSSILKKIQREDVEALVINGEGTLHSGNEYWKVIAEVVRWSKGNGLSIAVVNSSIYLDEQELEFLRFADYLSVRSTASMRLAARVRSQVKFIPDLSFFSPPTFSSSEECRAVYTDSVTPAISFKLFLESVRNDCEFLVFLFKPEIRFGSLRLLKRMAAGRLINICFVFFSWLWLQFKKDVSLQLVEEKIAKAEKVVSGRFHATCFALKYRKRIEFLSSNTRKVEDLIEDVGVFDLFEKREGRFRMMSGKDEEYFKRLDEFMAFARELREEFDRDLKRFVDGDFCRIN